MCSQCTLSRGSGVTWSNLFLPYMTWATEWCIKYLGSICRQDLTTLFEEPGRTWIKATLLWRCLANYYFLPFLGHPDQTWRDGSVVERLWKLVLEHHWWRFWCSDVINLFLYVDIYVYIYICIYMFVYIYIYIYIYIYMCIFVYVYIYIFIYIYIYI